MKDEKEAAPENEGCQSKDATQPMILQIVLVGMDSNDAECSTVDSDAESTSVPICPGWPPAAPKAHEREWPRIGGPHPIVHDR